MGRWFNAQAKFLVTIPKAISRILLVANDANVGDPVFQILLETTILCQILNWYAKIRRIKVDPISDQKFIREIIRKLPREVRVVLICDREKYISEFAAKVAEIMTEGGYTRDNSFQVARGRNYHMGNQFRSASNQRMFSTRSYTSQSFNPSYNMSNNYGGPKDRWSANNRGNATSAPGKYYNNLDANPNSYPNSYHNHYNNNHRNDKYFQPSHESVVRNSRYHSDRAVRSFPYNGGGYQSDGSDQSRSRRHRYARNRFSYYNQNSYRANGYNPRFEHDMRQYYTSCREYGHSQNQSANTKSEKEIPVKKKS